METEMGLASALKAQFQQGEESAMDPENEQAPASGRAVTTLHSRWLFRCCSVCGHTFRMDDPVEIGPDRKVRHASAELPCSGGGTALNSQPPESAEARSFFQGLDESWPPPRDLPIHRLEFGSEPGNTLLKPPFAGFKRQVCGICGHSLRPHDQVIICPCRPGNPMCILAVHRDPMHRLNCWESWNPHEVQQYCLATSRKLK